jgi:hypothetical protein
MKPTMSDCQTLAWIAWRTRAAIDAFSGPDAKALWGAACAGHYPPGLGKPKITPIAAEQQLRAAMDARGRVIP